jgi:hypothetical protein
MWARRETQHAARDERSETKHKREKHAKLSEQRETRGELAQKRRRRDEGQVGTRKKQGEIVVQREAAEDGSMAEA